LSIQILGEELSELPGIDFGTRQDRLMSVLTGTGVVVMLCQDGSLAEGRGNARHEKKNCNGGRSERAWATERAENPQIGS
jgi:hypothetical protein